MILRSSRHVLFLPCASFVTNSFSKIIIISTSVPQHRYQNTNRLQRYIDTKTPIGFNATSIPKHQSASTQHRYQNTKSASTQHRYHNITSASPFHRYTNTTSSAEQHQYYNTTSAPTQHRYLSTTLASTEHFVIVQ